MCVCVCVRVHFPCLLLHGKLASLKPRCIGDEWRKADPGVSLKGFTYFCDNETVDIYMDVAKMGHLFVALLVCLLVCLK